MISLRDTLGYGGLVEDGIYNKLTGILLYDSVLAGLIGQANLYHDRFGVLIRDDTYQKLLTLP